MTKFLSNLILLIRVKHWIKNAAVLLPLFFAGGILNVFQTSGFAELIKLFFAFCLASSSIYIINDIVDVEKDKLHPEKCKRPIASGFFSIKSAIVIFLILFAFLIVLLTQMNASLYFVAGYFFLNVLYSFKLKQIAIVDVACISMGFVLRILAGGVAADVFVSQWMVIIVFLLTISIAFSKRRDDLILNKDLRASLSGYNLQFIDIAKSISFSITLISYIMYSISNEVQERIGSDKLYITSLFVFLGIMRYLQISIVEEKSGSPVKILTRDLFLQIIILLWILTFTLIIYGNNI
ncbi:MAG: UbiA prenyltransferase family protein [Bacteroidales bacterium]|nr:UbiA prenyltransferase family protein [Bacteroidales bacterium]